MKISEISTYALAFQSLSIEIDLHDVVWYSDSGEILYDIMERVKQGCVSVGMIK
jgi:hypothetical protein